MDVDDITVVVPAHDEVHVIGDCLTSLGAAAAAVAVPVSVVVVLDACTDGTGEVVAGRARGMSPDVRAVAIDARRVGLARAAGFRGAPRGPGSWYATTDADSRVPVDWLTAQVESARDHDVFVGTVEVADWSTRCPGLRPEYERYYVRSAGHRHVHGTSVGLSARAYWQVGGFSPVRADEDVALVEACTRAGLAVDWSGRAPVLTSSRHSHRTPRGFASYLVSLEATLLEGTVPS